MSEKRLAGSTVAILMESDFVEPEIHYYQRRFTEEGARVEFLTRLWGQESITFHGHEYGNPFTVSGDLEAVDDDKLDEYDMFIVPSGIVSDRLRYTDDVNQLAPAVQLLRRAFERPNLLKGIICHGLWLAAPIPEVVRGRRLTCHNNLVGDARNMGAIYTDQDVVVDGDLVTGRSFNHCHEFARMMIDLVAAARAPKPRLLVTAGAGAAGSTPAALPEITGNGSNGHGNGNGNGNGNGATAVISQLVAPPANGNGRTALERATPQRPAGYQPDFTFSDLVAGYITGYDPASDTIDLKTNEGKAIQARLTSTTSAEFLRNLGEPYVDATGHLDELLKPGGYLFAYGIHYPENGAYTFEAKRVVFLGRQPDEYNFERPDWWVRQLSALAKFYRKAQFGEGTIDYANYRTALRLGGEKNAGQKGVQETDTISRLVYGMASAYMLTGDEDFLDVAEQGTAYLREHMRFVDRDEDVVYWYHGIEVRDGTEHKLFTSEFGDDYDAIPMYEQIYALAGPIQLWRLTGDPKILDDAEGTLRLFRKFYHDPEQGGWYSHIDPILLSPHHESLGPNRSRKNWNSVGDHAPAYLTNLYLGTGDPRHAEMLEETFDLIVKHFPQEGSPFVQERFHADWSADRSWSWQQDRAVVGHNLKIAWNLMRMMAVHPKDGYRRLAVDIGRKMPEFGADPQRGGWYDVVEQHLQEGQELHRFVWHDRKAWWQQEQAILAYQILAGHTGDAEFRRRARESSAFYNSFFLDHDEGGVYFNVLANGLPYLLGNERSKGSHSMSMYHGAELCFLATVYQRLLLDDEPLTLHFRPKPDGFADRILRVAPDALPPGRVRLDWVEIDGRPYQDFDATALTVKLPDSKNALRVRAHLSPVGN
ncbi:AGE family epimerase/isomerase [Sphaerisporangium sp. NPDC051011]|uniref:AGE family epimerase/isomerase n=1 Tax=Sphaerisporangium sp. NPDC051011 TaxID=3155792 RepID=UPI0033E9FED3